MSDWTEKVLGDVAEVRMGQSPPGHLVRDLQFGTPFLQGNAEFGAHKPEPRYECDDAPRRAYRGDTLISVRAPVGAINQADRDYRIGRGLAAIRFSGIDSSFGRHALRRNARKLALVSQGTTFAAIGGKDLRSLPISVPPAEEQRRIAEILDTIDETIQATERVIAKSKISREGLLVQLVKGRTDERFVPLSEVGLWMSGGTPSTQTAAYWGGSIPWITSSSLYGKYLSASERTLTEAGLAAGSRRVQPGTILFIVRGMSLKKEFRIGIAAKPVAFGQDCKALIPDDRFLSEFVYLQLRAREPEILKLVDEASHGTGRLQTSLLGKIPIANSTLAEQRSVVSAFQHQDNLINAEIGQLEKLRRTRAGLAADLLSGRVRKVAS